MQQTELPSATFKKKPKELSFTIQHTDDNFDNLQPSKRVQFISHFHHGLKTTRGSMVFMDRDNPISPHSSPLIICFGGNNSTRVATKDLYYLELEPHYCEILQFEWKKIEISMKQNPDHVPPPGYNALLVYSPKFKCLITAHAEYSRPVCLYCFMLDKREWIKIQKVTGIWYMDEIDLYCTNEYLFIGYLFDYHLNHQEIFRMDLDVIGDLLTKENEQSTIALVNHPKSQTFQSIRLSDGSIYRKVNIYNVPRLNDEESQFHICVFGSKNSATPTTEIKSFNVRSLNSNSKFASIPIQQESEANRSNSYMCRIPSNVKEDVYGIPKSMLLSYMEKNRIMFVECEYPKLDEKPQQFLLRYNNVPIQISIQFNVFRPFLHCYMNKHGKRVGIYIVNSQIMYFINLDYLAPKYCFNMLNQGSLHDIDIITRSTAFI